MTAALENLRAFLAQTPLALVEVASAKGSTPRDAGTWMLVSRKSIYGTIGGGQLEYMAIDKARQMLRAKPTHPSPALRATSPQRGEEPMLDEGRRLSGLGFLAPLGRGVERSGTERGSLPSGRGAQVHLSIPLGPEIGQCCGGKVDVSIRLVDDAMANAMIKAVEAEEAALPHVYLFGGGHVGHALAAAMALLPVRVVVVETREEELADLPAGVEARLTPMPEDVVRDAPAGAAFLVLTHDHALDFVIVAEALKRTDAAYVGMIGSKTKKATFRSWYLKNADGSEAALTRLISPIGGDAVKDKRPAVIAALAAAEVMAAIVRVDTDRVKA